ISTNYYARVERGEVNPSIDVFEDIVKALKVKSSKIINF
ncbi:helix-turn-helix domain-containing protein, partial [Patescibacteria group bacterium]|nr:helix-turn-helix domain-containing protein [Patescibacteria group bacterium]MBU1885220.1 helix-turn-helix domain-containing protein [Patescibacteria group bacterium]